MKQFLQKLLADMLGQSPEHLEIFLKDAMLKDPKLMATVALALADAVNEDAERKINHLNLRGR